LTSYWKIYLKGGGKKTLISKIRNTKVKIQGIIGDYFENPYSNKFENLEVKDKF
jgi:hypothetical protein